jgi:hypothetical protein
MEASMNKLLLAATTISVMLMPVSASAVMLNVTQNPNPFEAFEGTTGNIGIFNVANVDTTTARIRSIAFSFADPVRGELDDQPANITLIGPNPTIGNPLILNPGTNFNIKFSWDAVDNIKDNDVDFGLWDARFNIDIVEGNILTSVGALVQVNDLPIPAALPLFATGIGGLGLLGWRRKRKAQRSDNLFST